MDAENLFWRLRGAVGNALVWGASWTATAFGVTVALRAAGLLPGLASWLDAIAVAGRFGVVGAIAGGAFSLVVGLLYRGRRLSEIRWVRFGLGGGLVAGVFVPSFMTVARLLSGDAILPLAELLATGLLSAGFGGIAAGTSLKLAQRAEAALPVRITGAQKALPRPDAERAAEHARRPAAPRVRRGQVPPPPGRPIGSAVHG